MEDINDFVKLLREQRHDFMNHFQVIYGYLQMGKIEEAKECINIISERNQIISAVYNMGDEFLAICFERNIKQLWQKEVKVVLDVEIDNMDKSIFRNDYYKKCSLVNNIFNEMENNNLKFVYIYFFEDALGKNLFISNNEDLVDELSWMDEWDNLTTDISSFKLYKCSYEDNLAYRVVCS